MSKVGVDDFLVNGGDLNDLPVVSFTPKIAPEAFYGIAGRIVAAISPQSEADPVAILAHILVAAGNVIGRGPHALVEKTEHTCGEFVVLVGDSAKGRKGQAWSVVRSMLSQIDEPWATTRIRSGLSSGEGLIYNVRDQREEKQPIKEKNRVVDYQQVVVDEGKPDKRLFVIEPEFATTLRRMKGETNTLSMADRASRQIEQFRAALWKYWTLMAQGPEADERDARETYEHIVILIDELGPTSADRLRHAWEVEWFKQTGQCPRCGLEGERHT